MVLLEAREFGLPCIAFKSFGPCIIIKDGEDGILIDNGDIENFAKRLQELINDKELMRQLGNRAKNNKKFNIDDICEKWNMLLENVLLNKV